MPSPFMLTLLGLLWAISLQACVVAEASTEPWRSELYPADWTPPTVHSADFRTDKLLQDFSFAGYRNGEHPIPDVAGPIFKVTDPQFNADPTGQRDSTAAIQKAIDQAAEHPDGGVVFIPAGIYQLSVQGRSALTIQTGRIVLRGEGPDKTFLFNHTNEMRSRAIIDVQGPNQAAWRNPRAASTPITRDLPGPTQTIPVADTRLFKPGEYCIVLADVTPEWVRERQEPGWLGHEARLGGPAYFRKILAVDHDAQTITIDAPTRYTLLTRDQARVAVAHDMPAEIGIEHLAIGNLHRPEPDGWGERDYTEPQTAAWHAHNSWAIRMTRVRDSWVRNVHSFRHPSNLSRAHLLSNGILLSWCRGVTITECAFGFPQYGGGGGNGYMVRLANSNECLVKHSIAEFNRHGFVLSGMASSGNVFHRCIDRDTGWATGATGRLRTAGRSSDHHMHFSHSNLYDQCTGDSSWFQAVYRPWGTPPLHNITAAHSVFWNTTGTGRGGPIVETEQFHYGYAIGTQGSRTEVQITGRGGARMNPPDHVEGVGQGDQLQPASLFLDQRQRRLQRIDP